MELVLAAGYFLTVKGGVEKYELYLYPVQNIRYLNIKDDKNNHEYPVLEVGDSVFRDYYSSETENVVATASNVGLKILLFPEHQKKAAARLLEDFDQYPRFAECPNESEFLDSLTHDSVHHEATHLLLFEKFPMFTDSQECVNLRDEVRLGHGVILGYNGCFVPLAMHEMCGMASELQASTLAGSWTHMDLVDGSNAPNYNLVSNAIQPYSIRAAEGLAEQHTMVDTLNSTRTVPGLQEIFSLVGSKGYTLAITQQVGRDMYDTCHRGLEKSQQILNKN